MGSSLRISGRALAPHQGHLHTAGALTSSNRDSLEECEVHEGTINQTLALPLSGMRPNRRPLFVFGGCFRGIKGPLLSLNIVNRLNGWLHLYMFVLFSSSSICDKTVEIIFCVNCISKNTKILASRLCCFGLFSLCLSL